MQAMPDDSPTTPSAPDTEDCQTNSKQNNSDSTHDLPARPTGTYIGFDFGEKRIGLAIGQTETLQASPLTTVRNINGRPQWSDIDDIVAEWLPVGLVVGMPLKEDGTAQQQSILSTAFARKLRTRYSLPVFRCDERYSSIEASDILAENRRLGHRRRKLQRTDTDKTAAAIILDDWLSGSMAL